MTTNETTWGVLADIHGNALALAAVLDDCAAEGIERFIVPGDLAWGPDPRAVLETVLALGDRALVVRGNADREVANPETLDVPDLVASTAWCAEQLTGEQRAWLRGLPLTVGVSIPPVSEVLVCHGTPDSDTGRLRPDIEPDGVRAALAGLGHPIVVCGHSHVRFDVVVDGTRVVNPGSVGLHYGAMEAQWATVGPAGITMRSTPYDRERAASETERSSNPDAVRFGAFFRDPLA